VCQLDALCQLGDATAADVADELGIVRSAARDTLQKLAAKSIITTTTAKTGGRPAIVYHPSKPSKVSEVSKPSKVSKGTFEGFEGFDGLHSSDDPQRPERIAEATAGSKRILSLEPHAYIETTETTETTVADRDDRDDRGGFIAQSTLSTLSPLSDRYKTDSAPTERIKEIII